MQHFRILLRIPTHGWQEIEPSVGEKLLVSGMAGLQQSIAELTLQDMEPSAPQKALG